jgi:hypothetical protein
MALAQTSGWCHVCQQQRMMTKPKINHVLHLILTLVTFGLWGLVWLTLGIISANKGFRCAQCGTKAGHGAQGSVPQAIVPPPEASRGPVQMPEIPGGPEQPKPKPWETP